MLYMYLRHGTPLPAALYRRRAAHALRNPLVPPSTLCAICCIQILKYKKKNHKNRIKKNVRRNIELDLLSKSSVLLTRKITTNLTLSQIRDTLNKEFKSEKSLPDIFCSMARDNISLIIKSPLDEKLINFPISYRVTTKYRAYCTYN